MFAIYYYYFIIVHFIYNTFFTAQSNINPPTGSLHMSPLQHFELLVFTTIHIHNTMYGECPLAQQPQGQT